MSLDSKNAGPEVILWAEYPDGRDKAAVQSDGRSVYFLIQSDDFPQPKLVWVRNLGPSPLVFSNKDAETGVPPLLPETYCNHPKGLPPLDLESCRIFWFPQGLGAALFEGEQLLALIPPLPPGELPGFSRDCIHPCSVALPLDDDDHYLPITRELRGYWESWTTLDAYKAYRNKLLSSYQSNFGDSVELFTTENKSWPPVEIAVFQDREHWVVASIGMGTRAQIGIEKELQNFRDHQQMELICRLPRNSKEDRKAIGSCVQWLVGLVRYPWFHRTCFLPGHTVSIPPEMSEWFGNETGYLVPEPKVASTESRSPLTVPAFGSLPVNLLWLSHRDVS